MGRLYTSNRPMRLGYSFEEKVRKTISLNPEWNSTEKRAYWLGLDDAMFACYGKDWLNYSYRIFGIIFPKENK